MSDGRREHMFRQSMLGSLDMCPEQVRRQLAGETLRVETDATAVGTAVHAAIEQSLTSLRDYGDPFLAEDLAEYAQNEFTAILASEQNFKWVKGDEADSRDYIAQACADWHNKVLPDLQPLHMEYEWGPYVLHADDDRVIRMHGTIDYVDANLGLADWKTASRPYQRWEKQRWAIQPTVYTWAWWQATEHAVDEPIPFTYIVLTRRDGVQQLTVTRTPGDWEWLRQKALAVAKLVEADLDCWPLNDAGWWCSDKWCPAWSACKGDATSSE